MSGYGFGNLPFGNFGFGRGDFGRASILKAFPPTYLVNDDGTPNTVLQHYLEIAKHSVNELKNSVDHLENQYDPNTIRSDILQYLGQTLDVTVDEYEPVEFRRSLINNAILFYQIKGTENSYRIRGKISGYDVDVVNIYKIQPFTFLNFCDVYVSQGDGSASQLFENIDTGIGTYPIVPGSIEIKVNGVVVGADNGSGGLIDNGGTYSITGTIDYSTGFYSFTTTPAPPIGQVVRWEFDSSILLEELAVSTGASSYSFVSVDFYPQFPTSVVIKVNGIPCGQDDGSGRINAIGGAPYPCTGTVDYLNMGKIDLVFSVPPPIGALIQTTYNKTYLSEFLILHADDVYEIPDGSGNWYVTLPPGTVPGTPLEPECNYCLTTFIKIKFTSVKSFVGAPPPGSESFFDRTIRKIREIIPIHVRDLLYELVIQIWVDEHQYIEVDCGDSKDLPANKNQEITWIPVSCFHRFDQTPADCILVDKAGVVSGTVELV